MAQHDYVIANGTGAAVRSDLNNALAAIVSQNSGATEPATMYAYQWWADTTTGLLKLRNAANNAWITLRELDGTLTIEAGTVSAPGLAFASDLNTGVWSPGADQFAIATNGVERVEWGTSEVVFNDGGANYDFRIEGDTNANLFFVDASAEAVGIGTTSPSNQLTVGSNGTSSITLDWTGDNLPKATFSANHSTGEVRIGATNNSGTYFTTLYSNNSEAVRIDSSRRLLVGTSSARSNFAGNTSTPLIQTEGTTAGTSSASIVNNSNGGVGSTFNLGKSRASSVGGNTVVASGDQIGIINFQAADGTNLLAAASIEAAVDGTPGASDMPGRLVFSTTADGASSPTERMRINQAGAFKASVNGSYVSSGGGSHEFNHNAQATVLELNASNASYQNSGILFSVNRSANSIYTFFDCVSGGIGGDFEFRMKGDGNAYADGSWSGGGADYAEYFEWSDSNLDAEDRRGISVVLDGNKIREAQAGEDPIGVISGNPSVVGDAAWNKWSGKYLRDEFGTYIQEDYDVTDDDGNTVIQQRRKLNPAYDPDVEYISREQRPEWDCVGLMGKLRIRKGQVTGSRWIKMRDISDSVEEWLVR